MHNCSAERMKLLSPKSAQTLISTMPVFQPALILLVELHNSIQSPKILLGTDKRYCVIDVHTVSEVIDLRDEDISVAVLSVALGWPVLRSAATSVRRQWPAAKILLQGSVKADFDDHLYDMTADSAADPDGFMRVLEMIAGQKADSQQTGAHEQRPDDGVVQFTKVKDQGGLSKGMDLIRSSHRGPWSRVLGVR